MARKRTTDARGRLVDDPFDHRETKAGEVIVSRGGRTVMMLGGARAAALLRAIEKADDRQTQLLLAKATGHYKQ